MKNGSSKWWMWFRLFLTDKKMFFVITLTGIVEKQHELTPLNFFFKFSFCITVN